MPPATSCGAEAIPQQDLDTVWTADRTAHHARDSATYASRSSRLVTAGVEMDVLGFAYADYTQAAREAVVRAHPRSGSFKEDIIQAFYDGFGHKPDTTFGTVNADVLADKDPSFRRRNFCSVIRGSAWQG